MFNLVECSLCCVACYRLHCTVQTSTTNEKYVHSRFSGYDGSIRVKVFFIMYAEIV